jgi:dTDP-4-amino-4,6-dideoxygalactose transaminase
MKRPWLAAILVLMELKVPPASVYVPPEDREWILARIDECLASGRLTLGPHGAELEKQFAERCGVRYAVAVNSGTSALEIILRAIGVEGREVIIPTNTFYATAGAALHAGARIRFADCEPESFALDVDDLRKLIGPQTVAVVVVHIGGVITPKIDEIARVCQQAGVPLVEDAAHAHGCKLNGRPAGSFGRAAAFSFYPTKVMTSGEGGILVTDDEAIQREALIYRDQGKEGFTTNFHVRLGYNWRMSEPHAVIGLAQLRRLDEFIQRRNAVAAIYDEGLKALAPVVTPVRPPDGALCNYYKHLALLDGVDRTELKKLMRGEYGVGLSGEVYDTPCHKQPVFAAFADRPLSKAEDLCARHICLPVSAKMTDDDARYVLQSLEAAVSRLATEKVV